MGESGLKYLVSTTQVLLYAMKFCSGMSITIDSTLACDNRSKLYCIVHITYRDSWCITGTYNNQYMVLDLKKIELNKTINDEALWIVEQIPG